jgi:predicted ester cyclase
MWRRIAAWWRTAFPNLQITVLEEIVQGDAVVQRVTARGTHLGELRHPGIGVIPPTGRSFEGWDQIHIWHVTDGRISDHWATRDDLKLLQQLGVVGTPILVDGQSRLAASARCGRA